jgi:hypothetical protein
LDIWLKSDKCEAEFDKKTAKNLVKATQILMASLPACQSEITTTNGSDRPQKVQGWKIYGSTKPSIQTSEKDRRSNTGQVCE